MSSSGIILLHYSQSGISNKNVLVSHICHESSVSTLSHIWFVDSKIGWFMMLLSYLLSYQGRWFLWYCSPDWKRKAKQSPMFGERRKKIKIKNQDKERGVCHFCPPSLKPAPHIFQCNIPVVRMVASRSFSGFLWGGKKQNSMIFTSVYWINFRCHPFLAWPLCLPGSSTQILE